jgi:hypothetical protein
VTRLRRLLAQAGHAVMIVIDFTGVAIGDLPRPSDWLAARRERAEERRPR